MYIGLYISSVCLYINPIAWDTFTLSNNGSDAWVGGRVPRSGRGCSRSGGRTHSSAPHALESFLVLETSACAFNAESFSLLASYILISFSFY